MSPPESLSGSLGTFAVCTRVIEALRPCLQPRRYERLTQMIRMRCHAVQVVLEHLSDPHNGAACVRTLDGMGVQDLHVIEKYEAYTSNETVAAGADRWVTLYHHNSAKECLEGLRRDGFRIWCSNPSSRAVPISDLPCTPGDRVAVVFGNEHRGVSPLVDRISDVCFRLPMVGMTQSYNLSVSVAMTLFALHIRGILRPDLTEQSQAHLLARILCRDVRGARAILANHGIGVEDL